MFRLSQSLSSFGFVTRATRPVPLVVLKRLPISEHLSSFPVLSGVCGAQSFSFLCCVLQIVVCPSVLFPFDHYIVCRLTILITPLVSTNCSCPLTFLVSLDSCFVFLNCDFCTVFLQWGLILVLLVYIYKVAVGKIDNFNNLYFTLYSLTKTKQMKFLNGNFTMVSTKGLESLCCL